MNIPKDFESSFELSDVVLLVEDPDGNEMELHANKTFLSICSSFFKRLFFSGFIEANSDKVKISCSYQMMKLILEIIYSAVADPSKLKKTFELDVLGELYKAADYLDFPLIRNLGIEQMLAEPSIEMATTVLLLTGSGLDLHDTLTEILKKMTPGDVKKFLFVDDSHLLFSKKDVKLLFQMVAKKELPVPEVTCGRWVCPSTMPDLSECSADALIDSTQKWNQSDLLIKTKNSEGKELYSCKTVLAMVSPHFAEMFLGPHATKKTDDLNEIEVNVEYMVMKNILSIIHHSYNTGNLAKFVALYYVNLYGMYKAAAEDQLNIPIIRRICGEGLLEQNLTRAHWELAINLNLPERVKILEKIDTKEVFQWVHNYSDDVHPEYFFLSDDLKAYKANYISETALAISLNEVRIAVEKLLDEYTK